MRRARLVTALLALLPITGPADAAPSPAEPVSVGSENSVSIYSIRRVSKTPRRFHARITGRSAQERGAVTAIALTRTRTGWAVDPNTSLGYFEMGPGQSWVSTYGPVRSPDCPAGELCAGPIPRTLGGEVDSTRPSLLEYFVVTAFATAQIEMKVPGWRISEIRTAGFHRVLKEDAQATGVDVMRSEVEHFTAAETPGGRYGSYAAAVIPCDGGGHGEAHLTGGRNLNPDNTGSTEPIRLWCDPPDYIAEAGSAEARGPTRWRLAGDVWGVGSYNARLAVFDFPKP